MEPVTATQSRGRGKAQSLSLSLGRACRTGFVFGNCHQCGGHTALLSEGHTPPSVMPIYSPHGSASGGNENSTGDSLVRCLEGLPWGVATAKRPLAHDSRILLALACLPFLPAAPSDRPRTGEGALSLMCPWGLPARARSNLAEGSRQLWLFGELTTWLTVG